MECQIEESKEEISVKIQGSLKEAEGTEILESVRPFLSEERSKVFLNLSEVDFISSTSLGALVKLYNEVSNLGGSVQMVDVPANIQEILRITHLDKFFSVEIDVAVDELSLLDGDDPLDRLTSVKLSKEAIVLDPSSRNRSELKRVLEDLKVSTKEASSAKEALGFLSKSAPDLLVMEMELPDSNGLELLNSFKKINSLGNVPIVAISSKGEREFIVQAVQTGVKDYITKPYKLSHVKERLRKVLELSE